MGLRLFLADLWLPKRQMLKKLQRVDYLTNQALDKLVSKYSRKQSKIPKETRREGTNLESLRLAMAVDHNAKVATLIDVLGKDLALKKGRSEMFKVGMRLGEEARLELSVGDSTSDLFKAARILYRVLGINFQAQQIRKGRAVIHIDRCTLSKYYTELACKMLCAIDEGVVYGLNPRAEMTFEAHMTSGAQNCRATINISN